MCICFEEFLNQLNFLYICIYMLMFTIDQVLWTHEIMDRIMSYDHSQSGKYIVKLILLFYVPV
jgi:hypothetical protein